MPKGIAVTERRRNQFADACYVCRENVPAGAGWLYADVKSDRSRSRHRAGRGWRKQVKCDRCHTLNLAHKVQVDNLNRPPEPIIRPWSVTSVRTWDIIQVRDEAGLIAFDIVAGSTTFRGTCRDCITHRLDVPHCFGLVGGKPLSEAAHDLLRDRLEAILVPFWEREKADREAKVAALVAQGGEVVERYLSWVKVRLGDQVHNVFGNEE